MKRTAADGSIIKLVDHMPDPHDGVVQLEISHPERERKFDVLVGYWNPVCITDVVIIDEAMDPIHLTDFLPFKEFDALCRSLDRRFDIRHIVSDWLMASGHYPPKEHVDWDAMRKDRLDMLDERGAP